MEALVHWDDPTCTLLYPDSFLDLVEGTGLMRSVTRMVLRIALDQAAKWHAGGRQLTVAVAVAVDLSASSLVDGDRPDEVAAMLASRHLPPGALQLEITAEFLTRDGDQARNILTRLRQGGVQIAVDDFGTGLQLAVLPA